MAMMTAAAAVAMALAVAMAVVVTILMTTAAAITTKTTIIPDSKVHGANMVPIWGRQDPGGPQIGPMNFAIWDEKLKWNVILRLWNMRLHNKSIFNSYRNVLDSFPGDMLFHFTTFYYMCPTLATLG